MQRGFHLERLDAVSAVWILQNSPSHVFRGGIYVSDRTRNGYKVIIGRDRAGGVLIDRGARDNFVVDEGVVELSFVRVKPVLRSFDPYRQEMYPTPTPRKESRKEKFQRELEESRKK